jgi:hypothetical protein
MTGPAHDSGSGADDKPKARADAQGRAFKGSQLQVQIYVNRSQQELERKVREELETLDQKTERFEWVSPLEVERFVEYQDVAFLRAVGLERLAPKLAAILASAEAGRCGMDSRACTCAQADRESSSLRANRRRQRFHSRHPRQAAAHEN